MKKRYNLIKITRLFLISSIVCLVLLCSSCGLISRIIEEREEYRLELFNKINEIEKKHDYAFICENGYSSTEKNISFKGLVEDEIKKNKKKVEDLGNEFQYLDGDIIFFLYRYKEEKRFFGLNDKNNNYAVGTISLLDYSINIEYFECKYEKIFEASLTKSHYLLQLEDTDKKTEDKRNFISGVITIDRYSNELKEWDDYLAARESVGWQIDKYKNPTTFIQNEITYTVSKSSVTYECELKRKTIDAPKFYEVMETNNDVKKIAEYIGEDDKYSVDSYFITNGEDLFVAFFTSSTMFGDNCELSFPVYFKYDLRMNTLDFIGCVNLYYYFYENIKLIKL